MHLRRLFLAAPLLLICPLLSTFGGAQPLAPQPHDMRFVIVLIGPTGAGKTTQAAFIKKRFGIPALAIDDLVSEHPAAVDKDVTPGINPGPPQDRPVLNELVRKALSKMDLTKGVVLDGYPATKEQADYLAAMVRSLALPAPVIIQMDVPDDVVRLRLQKRALPEDKPDLIEARLKTYHREMDFIRSYYPQANIWTIDGAKTEREVSDTIAALITDEIPKKARAVPEQ